MKERITLKHIAKIFDVSIATVSKSLNDSHEISTETKKKIQAYAKEQNYKPNSIALSLLNKKTKTIGIIIPNILNSFFAKAFVGMEKVASENGFNIISCITNESYEKEVNIMELLKNGTLDGFIISLSEGTQVKQDFSHLTNAINEGLPIVMFDRVTDQVECDKVIVDDMEGAYNATSHLIRTGCKNIALLSELYNLSVGKLRLEGYKKALRDHNIEIDESLIINVNKNDDFDATLIPFIKDKNIDAILSLDENSAIKAEKTVLNKGYNIPEDMSIIGFTNGKLPRFVTPSISTISQHGRVVGAEAAQMLINRLNDDEDREYKTKVINTSLIQRESTKETVSN
ncbi:MAG: LacI family transcriptional regulator [Bacteroidia bacterium]|nr:LacI family transcriptional regulator [Bacteroidia bacterium]NND12141.1 LacI family DNA-binding transcriptional regulator [Flavobacteriaceae bacterium]MBT8309700.1 LacI family transcriptional regulator [Bacteroidia bacterium]NNK28942.1 LacI family DNA-binding transcriptional regulator [Flavobacteriaceae bacterium]NNL61464.1 LacI family DNA-binding transcriptional regulator [Flavobacteriaceae bacterium]